MIDATSLRSAMAEQGRVLYALVLREIQTRFGKHRIGYAWALVEPALHISVLYALRSLLGGVMPPHTPLLLWLISGIIPFFMFRSIVSRVAASVRGNTDLLILPPVRVMDIIWARTLLELATYSAILLFFFGLHAAIIGPLAIHDPLQLFACLLLVAWLGLGFGMLTITFTAVFPSTQPLVDGVLRILYFGSGVLFSINHMPQQLQEFLTWNPLLHVFEHLHAAMFTGYTPLPEASDLGFVMLGGFLMLMLGMMLVKHFMRAILDATP